MNYTNRHTRSSARTISIVSGVLFAVFCFLTLYVMQADMLSQLQWRYSGGQTTYHPLVGAMLCTSLLVLLGVFVRRVIRFPVRLLAFAWLPSLWLLWLVTSHVLSDGIADHMLEGVCLFGVVPIFFVCVLLYAHARPDSRFERSTFSVLFTPNVFVLALMFFVVGRYSDTATMRHAELRAARLVCEHRYFDALSVGQRAGLVSPTLFASRCYALSQLGQLGEELFCYPCGGSEQMLPARSDSTFVFDFGPQVYRHLRFAPPRRCSGTVTRFLEVAHRRDTLQSPVLRDYLLCAYLLDRRLDAFSEVLAASFPDSVALPRHYAEALMLCDESLQQRVDTKTETLYHSFQQAMQADTDGRQPAERLRDGFGHTYWYYYFFR